MKLDTSQQWQLFGYDMGRLGRRWQAAWRDFLWSADSPVRERLDEVVAVRDGESLRYFHADKEVPSAHTECDAVMLPQALVLHRKLQLPLAAEAELQDVMTLEVAANSPFPEADTSCGWSVCGRNEQSLELVLVIASLSSTMAHLGREYDIHDPHQREVWAEVEQQVVMLQGFGEQQRMDRYRRRLWRVAGMLGGSMVLVLVLLALLVAARSQEARQYRAMYADIQQQASQASRMRASLVVANESIARVDAVIARLPGAHRELARVTTLLPDDSFVTELRVEGREVTVKGRSGDAGALMERLISDPGYAVVTAPEPIRVHQRTGLEEYTFRMQLDPEADE